MGTEVFGIDIIHCVLLASAWLMYDHARLVTKVSRLKLKLRRAARELEDKSVLESEVKDMKMQLSLPPHRRLALQAESASSAESRRLRRELFDRYDILASRI